MCMLCCIAPSRYLEVLGNRVAPNTKCLANLFFFSWSSNGVSISGNMGLQMQNNDCQDKFSVKHLHFEEWLQGIQLPRFDVLCKPYLQDPRNVISLFAFDFKKLKIVDLHRLMHTPKPDKGLFLLGTWLHPPCFYVPGYLRVCEITKRYHLS